MKSLKTLLAAALLTVSASAMAQNSEDGVRYEFQKHPFITIQGGAQYTLGEAKFSDLLSPNLQLSFGYQFSPVFAARIQANAYQSKGGWNGYPGEPFPGEGYTNTYKWKYVAPGIDLMLNLSNLIAGYNPFRVVSLTAFLGGGANIGFSNDEANDIAAGVKANNWGNYQLEYVWDGTKIRPFGRGGLELAFRLSDAVSILVEGNANILSDKYNSKNGDNPDWYFNALAGLRINLGKTYNKIVPPAPEPEPIVEPEPEPEPVVVEPVVVKIEPIRRDVFFTINSYKIVESEDKKIKDVADYMIKYPESKVTVNGYADAGTGNDRINDRLAAQRADVVVKALKEKYGIAADRITYDSHGARVQPFAENDKNRVSICIAE
ncbi:MAG: OmpA family protein [Prevotella sp.]|nr:OmpA family protein [Prevotella sp.]